MYRIIKLLNIIFLLFLASQTFAQPYFDKGKLFQPNNGKKYGIGLAAGFNLSSSDFNLKGNGSQLGLYASYAPVRFLQFNAEFSKGFITGSGASFYDYGVLKNLEFESKFTQFHLAARLMPLRMVMWDELAHLGELFTYFYGSLGIGLISNNTIAVPMRNPEFGYIVDYTGTNLVFTQEIGIDIPLLKFKETEDKISPKKKYELFANANIRYNKINSDFINGYDPISEANKYKDNYTSYTFGLTLKF